MTPLARPNETEAVDLDDDLDQYRAVSGLAVAGLLAGICSILIFAHYLLYLVPLAAIVLNLLALRQISEASPPLVGRKAALAGLALALIFLVAAPIQQTIHQHELRAQSLQVAQEWFTALRDDQPETAFRLSQYPTTAATRRQHPLTTFHSGMMKWGMLRKFAHETPKELLLKLGKRVRVRLCAHQETWAEQEQEGVRDYFVVTAGKGSEAVSFFVLLGTTRTKELGSGDWQWQVSRAEFVHSPPPELIAALGE